MNIFLIRESASLSAVAFKQIDPVRARKQLLECCQILASVDILVTGSTRMLKADGSPYKLAHQHHPITKRCAEYMDQWDLCYDVARTLADEMPGHACSTSFHRWSHTWLGRVQINLKSDPGLILCRLGFDPIMVEDRLTYSNIMAGYLRLKHIRDKEKIK